MTRFLLVPEHSELVASPIEWPSSFHVGAKIIDVAAESNAAQQRDHFFEVSPSQLKFLTLNSMHLPKDCFVVLGFEGQSLDWYDVTAFESTTLDEVVARGERDRHTRVSDETSSVGRSKGPRTHEDLITGRSDGNDIFEME